MPPRREWVIVVDHGDAHPDAIGPYDNPAHADRVRQRLERQLPEGHEVWLFVRRLIDEREAKHRLMLD